MAFFIKCPQCGITLEADEKYIGVMASCAECDFHFTLQKNSGEPTTRVELLEFDFTNPPPKLTYAKPVSLVILGETIEVNSWRDIFLYCFNYSLKYEKNKVLRALLDKENNHFSTKLLLSSSITNLRQGKELSENLFLETNFNAVQIIKIVCGLIKFCGFPPEQCLIRYVSHETKDTKTSAKISVMRKSLGCTGDIDALRTIIVKEFNKGFVFNTGTIKLLENILGRECSSVELGKLKRVMFKRTDDIYLLPEMVARKDTIAEMTVRVKEYFSTYGCFSLSVLYDEFEHALSNLTNQESDFRLFLLKVILPNSANGKIFGRLQRQICIPEDLDEEGVIQKLASLIREILQGYGDAVFIEDLLHELPFLNCFALEMILQEYVADAIAIDVDGMSYWKLLESFCLPDDFADYLQLTVRSMEQVRTAPSLQTLSDVMEQQYGEGFREIYAIDDDDVFKQIVQISLKDGQYCWNRNVLTKQNSKQELNIADEFLQTQRGLFHESDFFDYAETHRGLINTGMLILTFLRNKCIRLDQTHWMSLKEFDELSNFSEEMATQITNDLDLLRGSKAFLSLGILPNAFLSSLPVLTIDGQIFYWNHYLLASIASHRISKIQVINDEPSPYTVTAMAIPKEVAYQGDVIDYVFQDLRKNHCVFSSVDDVFEYLRIHQIRVVKTKKLCARIRTFWGVE